MQLTDGDRIRGLLAAYCRLVDAGDFAGLGLLMADAVLCTEDGTVIATGSDEVAALYAGLVRLHENGTPGTQHLVANTVFDEPSEEATARATSSYAVFQAIASLPLQPIVTGTYVDTFARGDRGWHFTERRFGISLSGAVDQHLTIDPTSPGGSS